MLIAGSLWLSPMITSAAAQGGGGAQPAVTAPKAVLELFTSQGCSSCPPADALLKTYAGRPDVVALTLPVDYWDYLGWKDTLANPKFSQRQRAYAKQRGDGRIYTPQIVVNGTAHVNGASQGEIDRAIAAEAGQLARALVPAFIRADKGQIVIDLAAAPAGSTIREANIWLATIQDEAEIPVRSGENRGKTLKYYNIVRELTPVGMWNGAPMTVRIDREAVAQPGAAQFALIVQNGKAGPIVGAAMLR